MGDAVAKLLDRRRIEGEMVGPIHRILVRDFGREAADRIVGEAVAEIAEAAGRSLAARSEGPAGIDSLERVLGMWAQGGALEVEILHRGPDRFEYDVKRCRYAEMYRELGLADVGLILSCGRDGAFIRGCAPGIEMARTGTIMGGAPRCDFRFRLRRP
jgi:hypothetical protein